VVGGGEGLGQSTPTPEVRRGDGASESGTECMRRRGDGAHAGRSSGCLGCITRGAGTGGLRAG
jgi:hypothetical protein